MNERERWVMPKSPIIFIPRFIKQESDLEYGEVVTHENYNEKLNLNGQQGDYNTEILRLLFTEHEAEKAIHIPYLDKIIEQQVERLDNKIDDNYEEFCEFRDETNAKWDDVYNQLEDHDNRINKNAGDITELQQQILNIIDGTQVVALAKNLEGAYYAGPKKYYGTNKYENVGFYDVPDSLFAHDLDEGFGAEIDGIIIVPRPDSVEESMLSPAVRNKLNKESITSYPELDNKPAINNVVLVGNLSLDQLDIQRKGNYLTKVPSEYATLADTQSWVNNNFYTKSQADSKFALISSLSSNVTNIENSVAALKSSKNKVWLSQPASNNPDLNIGDLLVVV